MKMKAPRGDIRASVSQQKMVKETERREEDNSDGVKGWLLLLGEREMGKTVEKNCVASWEGSIT